MTNNAISLEREEYIAQALAYINEENQFHELGVDLAHASDAIERTWNLFQRNGGANNHLPSKIAEAYLSAVTDFQDKSAREIPKVIWYKIAKPSED